VLLAELESPISVQFKRRTSNKHRDLLRGLGLANGHAMVNAIKIDDQGSEVLRLTVQNPISNDPVWIFSDMVVFERTDYHVVENARSRAAARSHSAAQQAIACA
jgi:hypothetical protein